MYTLLTSLSFFLFFFLSIYFLFFYFLPYLSVSLSPSLSFFFLLVFRIGKGFDHLRIALQTIHLKDPVQRVLITLGKLTRFLFLLFDHLVWAGRLRLFGIDPKRWSTHSTRFWFLAITFGLLRDTYDIFRALKIEYSRLRHNSTGAKRNMSTVLSRTIHNNPALVLDVVKNSTDIFLPISSFKQGRGMSPGWVGLMGVVSSLCGLIAAWDKGLKLQYS